MLRYIIRTVSLLFSALFFVGQMQAQETQYGKTIVKTISSAAFKGRGYTEKGDRKAAKFLAKQYQQNGLLAFASNGNQYIQNYTVKVNYFPGKMDVRVDGIVLVPGVDYLIDATSPSVKGAYHIAVGTRHDMLDSTSLFNLVQKANGAFVYMDNSADSTETKEETAVINQNLRYLQSDSTLPIKGIILYSPKKLTWTVLPYQSPRPLIELHKQITHPQTIKLNIDAHLDTDYPTQNIAGYISGTEVPDSFLVISAHYDHLGKMGKKTIFYGANDNASGTGFILALMQYFQKHPSRYSIAFLSFSGEELGLRGSEYFVSHPLFDLKKIKFLCNFDMAGTGIDGVQIVNSTIFTQQLRVLDSINNQNHYVTQIKTRGEAANSDHYWFYKHGVPSFFFYTLGGVNYHDVNDTFASLPFDAWDNYLKLMETFIQSF
ncbi:MULTISPECIES: M28 family metallopeptidase [Chitinophagaceae]